MTYLVHTLQSSEASSPTPTPTHFDWSRLAVELWSLMGMLLVVVLALWVLWVMSLGSYSTLDAAWSTSGVGTVTLNRVGRLGAWVADASYFVLGFSVWWCVAAAVRLWIANVARWLHGYEWLTDRRSQARPARSAKVWRHLAFWLGLVLLLMSSASLEWSRFYRFEAYLPSHGGGIVGYFLGTLVLTWFGEVGSALVCIVLGLMGMAFIFRFSWAQLAEQLGAWLFAQIRRGHEKYELVQDSRQGQQAAKERVEALSQERLSHLEHPTVRIEPVMDTQKSTLSVKDHKFSKFSYFQVVSDIVPRERC
jgi:S-DNA-T family DNA segregation ATPase FtsK/SpoIIIE